MKPLLHPSSFLSLFFAFLISSNIPTSICQSEDEQYLNCSNAFSCGKSRITNFTYPFWGGNREKYCGDSGLEEVTCEDDVPKISINGIKYRINAWDNTTRQLTLAREDYLGPNNICRGGNDYKNSTFDNTPFVYDQGVANVSLFYDCPQAPTFSNIATPVSNPCGGRTVYYYVGDPFPYSSCTIVLLPIFSSNSSLVSSGGIYQALNNGFGLNWTGESYEKCKTCLDSGGHCGSNDGFQCFCRDGPHSTSCSIKGSSSKVVVAVAASAGAVALIGFIGCVFFVMRRKRRIAEKSRSQDLFMPPSSGEAYTSTTNTFESVSSFPSSKSETVPRSFYYGVQVFTYEELQEATKNFDPSRELGEGGFGTVYKGELKDGRVVAVKRHYESNFKRVEQFMNEVQILARLRHKNLVTLYGCTSRHSRELLLVYEFIPNGTVADHLQGKRSNSTLLPWPVRLNIAIETAEALAHLHAKDVIHRDVKSNNILLDEKFEVKVADFGLSRLFPTHVTHVSTAPQGTPGYVDPEYYQCYQLTDKSDVYSFGVVLVELISSLQAVDINRSRNDVNLANMAVNKIHNQELHELVDPSLGFERDYAIRRMTTAVAELAFRCLQQQRELRPSMDEVLEVLRGIKSDELGAKKEAEIVDIRADEVIPLKKVPSPVSPDSVVDKWVSGSSVSNSL